MVEVGQVLWFDRKKGFGFAKVVNPESELFEKELFVHYSSIQCNSSFKVLYPGETVSMDVERNSQEGEGQKEFLVSNVTGIYGAPLMIDHERYIFKVVRKSQNRGGEDVEEEQGEGNQ